MDQPLAAGSVHSVEHGESARPRRSSMLPARDKLLVLAGLSLMVGLIVGLQFLRSPFAATGGAAASGPATAGAVRAVAGGQIRGICLQLQSDDAHPFDKYIREIADTGANAICLITAAFQQNCGSSSIFIDARRSPSKARMRELIRLCHDLKMRVILMPIVLLENPREGEWRGKIDPSKETPKNSWDDWWEDYANYLLYWAEVAGQSKVEVFMVGSELISTERMTDRWTKLIEQVRKAYSGALSYSANWDHYWVPEFWDSLDIVGMTNYYDLTGEKKPSLEVLMESWADIKKKVLEWQAKVHRPILFTEVGWPNQETAARYPWDYYRAMDKRDPQLQKRCFEAFFKTWADEPAVSGYLVWEWRNHEGQTTLPDVDPGYVPKDKPAMEIIREYFLRPNPTTAPDPLPLSPTTSAEQP